MVSIVDNFLDQKTFDNLQSLMLNPDTPKVSIFFPWYYNLVIDYAVDVDKFQFVHSFYVGGIPTSTFMENLDPILEILKPHSIFRIKANLLTRTPNIIENEFHTDFLLTEEKLKQWTTSIFYVNTNNGYTEFEDGTKVESVANRMITFPANLNHRGTSCTDEKIRVVINFNYFSRK